MKKKISILLFSFILCVCAAVPAFADAVDGFASEHERVIDAAELLSDSEKKALGEKLDALSALRKTDISVLTVKTLDGKTPRDYADDFYDDGKFGFGEGRDGVLLLVCKEENDWYISTHGYGITAFTDEGRRYIGEKMKPDLSAGNFAAAFNTFAELCDDFIEQARKGSPYDVNNLPKGPLSLIWIPVSIAVGVMLSFVTVGKMKAKLKTVRFRAAAGSYMKDGSLNVTESRDMFLYNTVTRTAKPKNNSSGGSSTHTSSSGSTHGGGGGKF